MPLFAQRYASYTASQCEREAIKLLHHAWVSGEWKKDLPERLLELRKVAGYAPVPKLPERHREQFEVQRDNRVVWNKGQEPDRSYRTPAEEIAGLG